MLRTDVAESLREEFGEDGYLFPDYESYCFANVPDTVASVLGADADRTASEAAPGRTLPEDALAGVDAEGIERALVVLVDGFGFEQWRRQRDHHRFLDRLSSEARVTPLTSIYPSETAAAMNTFHTGALPAEHGVVGWNVYEPTADVAFEALPFQTKEGEEPSGVARSEVAEAETRYRELAEAGIDSHLVTPFPTADDHATDHSYETLDEFGRTVPAVVAEAEAPAYCFAYVPSVDAASHESGTESANYRETVGEVFGAVEQIVSGLDPEIAEETLLVVTADHGHVNTDPERNVNLDRWDWLLDALARHADGSPVRFSGSPRNVHLHLRDDSAPEEVAARLQEELDALAFTDEQALDRDLFGDGTLSETFRRRLGDVVLTHRDLGTWYGDEESEELHYVGMHGGLHPEEMLVPFAAVRAAELTE